MHIQLHVRCATSVLICPRASPVCSLESAAALGSAVSLAQQYQAVAQAILDDARTTEPGATPAKSSPLLPLIKVPHCWLVRLSSFVQVDKPACSHLPSCVLLAAPQQV